MSELALTATEPAASVEFFKLASLCRDSAERIERLSKGRPWHVSRSEEVAADASAAPAGSAETQIEAPSAAKPVENGC
ncbi:MAG TPA: hypothetical protein VMA53_06940 [Stellaceae bacterium]|nr:hypothetical protein [Stellaceae bacterium]